jgi:hypothetical protein
MKRPVLLAAFVILEASNPARAQVDSTKIEPRLRSSVELHQVSIGEASLRLLKSFEQPGGIVTNLSGDCFSERTSVFLPSGLDLRDALVITISSGSQWSWKMDNRVVNVLPRELPEVLSTKIDSFHWNTRDHVGHAVYGLFALNGVKGFLLDHRISSAIRSIVGPQKPPRFGVPPVQRAGKPFSLSETTLLDALNRVVESYGDTIWIYTERHCDGKREYDISVHRAKDGIGSLDW